VRCEPLDMTSEASKVRINVIKISYKLSPLMMKAKRPNGTPLDTLRLRKSCYRPSTEGCV